VFCPVRLGQVQDAGAVQAAGVAEVDVLDGRGEPQPGGLEAALDAAAGPVGQLAVDEQAEAFVEAEPGVAGLLVLLGEGGGHGVQPHCLQPVDGGGGEHDRLVLFYW